MGVILCDAVVDDYCFTPPTTPAQLPFSVDDLMMHG